MPMMMDGKSCLGAKIIALGLGLVLLSSNSYAGASPGKAQRRPQQLTGLVSQNELADALFSVGIRTIYQKENDVLTISSVRAGSTAFYKGLLKDDVVTLVANEGSTFRICVQRSTSNFSAAVSPIIKSSAAGSLVLYKRKTYFKDAHKSAVELRTSKTIPHSMPVRLAGSALDTDTNQHPKTALNAAKEEQFRDSPTKKMLDVEVELIVDRSGSMSQLLDDRGTSRLESCKNQAMALIESLKATPEKTSITLYGRSSFTQEVSSAEETSNMFRDTIALGNENLLDPLTDRLERYSRTWRRGCKPLLVLVFSDEYPAIPPNSFDTMYDVLAKFTRRTECQNQILVAFIQVGIQNDLYAAFAPKVKSNGATYKITAVVSFDEVSKHGLVNAIQSLLIECPLKRCPTLAQEVERNSGHRQKSSVDKEIPALKLDKPASNASKASSVYVRNYTTQEQPNNNPIPLQAAPRKLIPQAP